MGLIFDDVPVEIESKDRFRLATEVDRSFVERRRDLKIVPITLRELNALVDNLHRHHSPVQGHKFSIGVVTDDGKLIGGCSVGRPVARMTDHRIVVEVTRLVTDGTPNACSMLYSAAARVAKEMGYERIQTFILESEPGTSLLASGWRFDGTTVGGDWNSSSKPFRNREQPRGAKQRWMRDLTKK